MCRSDLRVPISWAPRPLRLPQTLRAQTRRLRPTGARDRSRHLTTRESRTWDALGPRGARLHDCTTARLHDCTTARTALGHLRTCGLQPVPPMRSPRPSRGPTHPTGGAHLGCCETRKGSRLLARSRWGDPCILLTVDLRVDQIECRADDGCDINSKVRIEGIDIS